jgi:RNA polymerase sigma factor (sigma-70 family)
MDTSVDTFPDRDQIAEKLGFLAEQTGDAGLAEARRVFVSFSYEESRDFVNTRLMDAFKLTGDSSTFSLLYDLNNHGFLCAIQNRIRAYRGLLEACDVMQEVFFNIYRYPHRFDGEKPEAFRHWTNTIIRNTVLKHLRQSGRPVRFEFLGEELAERPDDRCDSPLRETMEHEGEGEVARAYLITLQMYLEAFNELSDREQQALELVEVENLCYRDASAALRMKVENLKMVIFRARRKMYRHMRRQFAVAGVTASAEAV